MAFIYDISDRITTIVTFFINIARINGTMTWTFIVIVDYDLDSVLVN